MGLYEILSIETFIVAPFVIFALFYLKNSDIDLFYPIKGYISKWQVSKIQSKWRRKMRNKTYEMEKDILDPNKIFSQEFVGSDQKSNCINIKFIRISTHAYVHLHLTISNDTFILPVVELKNCRNETENSWSCNGLIIENLIPYKKVRIIFHGMLKHMTSKKLYPIKFHLLFNCCSPPLYFPEDASTDLLSNYLAGHKWTDGTWKSILDKQPKGYDQFGTLIGTIERFNETDDKQEIYNFQACRSKYAIHDSDIVNFKNIISKNLRIFLADSTGMMVNLHIRSFDTSNDSKLSYGYVFHKLEIVSSITKDDFSLQRFNAQNHFPKSSVLHINYLENTAKYVLNLNEFQISVQSDDNNNIQTKTAPLFYSGHSFRNLSGTGVIDGYFHSPYYTYISNIRFPHNLVHPIKSKVVQNFSDSLMVVNFADEDAKVVELCGGKGTSLALMSSIHNEKISIPEGIILTVNAFKSHVKENPQIQKAIDDIEKIFHGKTEGNCVETCEKAIQAFELSTISNSIIDEIFLQLNNLEEEMKTKTYRYAVRSSAVGEDSAELSAAGQNRTAMSIGRNGILLEILKCWASVYAYRSVQYRWQHGLPVKTSMAVVIQKQIPSDVAGVLFTWHPSTLNPSQMVITSNFGIGETVVSGVAEPDTFILDRTDSKKLEIIERQIGSKEVAMKILSKGGDDNESDVVEVKVSGRNEESLTDDELIRLGEIGIILERAFDRPVDIEWAFYKNHLYLLQCRPITTLTQWLNSELTYEFNSPVISELNVFTLANVGEVFPKPITPLNLITIDALNVAISHNLSGRYCEFNLAPIALFNNMTMIDVILGIHRHVKAKIDIAHKLVDIALLGYPVINERILEAAKAQLGMSTPFQIRNFYSFIYMTVHAKSKVRQVKNLLADLNMSTNEEESAKDFCNKIFSNLTSLTGIVQIHSSFTSTSVFWQIFIMSVLVGKSEDITSDHKIDLASILLASNDIESAGVPIYLENIGKIIANKGLADEFTKIPQENGMEWLKTNCQEAYELFQEFLEKHGHRGFTELTFALDRWGEDPSQLIPMIQANVYQTKKQSKEKKSVEDVIKELITPTKAISRTILNYTINKSRLAVGHREQTKSCLVLAIYKFKQAFTELGKKMVKEGLIPKEKLVFQFSKYELKQLLETNGNSGLVSKIMARERLYPQWCQQKFAEVSYGYPKLLPDFNIKSQIISGSAKCKGTIACVGEIKGRACVIMNFEDAGAIQKGDILITFSTDICWSPYFPMLSGVVTEIGGLVSHGAVVAREYGLPCIVGARNATKIFETGDIVFLSGKTGEIVKIEEEAITE